jgi:putative membrane protein
MKIYREMQADPSAPDVEIALICGDKNVGYRSDEAIVDELNIVIESAHPKGVILVGDGAEDEYIYPVISSRLPIDSVRKVYVTQ